MAEKLPVKYENKEHDVFAPGDTLPANVVNLFAHLREGAGIRLTPLAGGRVRIDNLCCEEPCVPNWQNTGQTRCGSSDTIEAEQTDGCGNTRWQNTGTPCEEPCVPNWQNTGTTRCTGANVENQQADGCGNLRWTDSGTPVTWTASGETRCNTTTNKVENEEVNQCGDARWAATVEDCECVPNWQNTGTQRCTGAYIEDQQADGCGNIRWQATATPVSWTDTGETRCEGSNYQSRQTNQCGDSRWHTTAPIAWTATGQQRCSAANVEVEEQNQCGTLRWRNTGTPVAWTATGPATCVSGTLRVPEQNQCGQTRVRDTGEACCTVTYGLVSIVASDANIEPGDTVTFTGTINPAPTGTARTATFVVAGATKTLTFNPGNTTATATHTFANEGNFCPSAVAGGTCVNVSGVSLTNACVDVSDEPAPMSVGPGSNLFPNGERPCTSPSGGPLSVSATADIVVLGGSGSFTYAWTVSGQQTGVTLAGASSDMLTLTFTQPGCPPNPGGRYSRSGTLSLLVTDTVTGLTLTVPGEWLLAIENVEV